MKMPSKGQPVNIENGGNPLFVGGRKLNEPEKAKVLLKYESEKLNEGYGQGIVTLPLDEFNNRRVYEEQLPDSDSLSDIIYPNELKPEP